MCQSAINECTFVPSANQIFLIHARSKMSPDLLDRRYEASCELKLTFDCHSYYRVFMIYWFKTIWFGREVAIVSRSDFPLRSLCNRVNLLSYESKHTDKREQYNWRAEKKNDGLLNICPPKWPLPPEMIWLTYKYLLIVCTYFFRHDVCPNILILPVHSFLRSSRNSRSAIVREQTD